MYPYVSHLGMQATKGLGLGLCCPKKGTALPTDMKFGVLIREIVSTHPRNYGTSNLPNFPHIKIWGIENRRRFARSARENSSLL